MERAQTNKEELANSISHGIGFLLSLIALPILVYTGWKESDILGIVGVTIFGASLCALYLSSTIYHAYKDANVKKIFKTIDHAAIFILIAGTYTPYALGVLRGPWGWTILSIVWSIALIGIIFKFAGLLTNRKYSTFLYLLMGWIMVIAIKPFLMTMKLEGVVLLGAGGLFYSAGVIFYLKDKYRYMHFIWHLFVMGGSICHFFSVIGYGL